MNVNHSKTTPVHVVRMGRIKAAIWENESQQGLHYNVKVSRIYKDGEQWRETSSFGRDDLPLLAKVVDQAHSWIFAYAQESHREAGFAGDSRR